MGLCVQTKIFCPNTNCRMKTSEKRAFARSLTNVNRLPGQTRTKIILLKEVPLFFSNSVHYKSIYSQERVCVIVQLFMQIQSKTEHSTCDIKRGTQYRSKLGFAAENPLAYSKPPRNVTSTPFVNVRICTPRGRIQIT